MTGPASYQPGDEIASGPLYRRIPDDNAWWDREQQRPTKYNFMPARDDEHLSMEIANDPDEILRDHPGYGLLEIDAADLKAEGLEVRYEPELAQNHVAVRGLKRVPNSKRERLRKRITRAWAPVSQQLVYERDKQRAGN